MAWDFNNTQAVYLQISERLRRDIVNGKYPPDSQIPPVRQLAFEASVNPNTMQKALSTLESEGIIYSKGTVGRFVTSDKAIIENAKIMLRVSFVKRILNEAKAMDMDADELIGGIKKEENKL